MLQNRITTLGMLYIIRRKKPTGPNIISEFTADRMKPSIYSIRTISPTWHIVYGVGFTTDLMLPEGARIISSTEMHITEIPKDKIAGITIPPSALKQSPDQLYVENDCLNRKLVFTGEVAQPPPIVTGVCVNVVGETIDENIVVKEIIYPRALKEPEWDVRRIKKKFTFYCFADNISDEENDNGICVLIGARRPIIQKDFNVVGALRQKYEKKEPVTIPKTITFAIAGPGDAPNIFPQKPTSLMSNPAIFTYDGLRFLITAGQTIEDIQKYGGPVDVFDAMKATLKWRLAMPTCPDTLFGSDDIIINECPHVYVCGGCMENKTELSNGCLFITVQDKISVMI